MQSGENSPSGQDAGAPLADALAGWCNWADMIEAYRSMLGAGARGSGGEMPAPGSAGGQSQNRDLLGFMSQAYLVFATSGIRSWTRTARTYAEHYPALSRLLVPRSSPNANDPEEQGILLDDLRALLRELAELSGQESQWMQAELAKLEGQMLSGASRQAGDYARQWKCKS